MENSRILRTLLTAARPWITDGGLETTLVFHEGLELPAFASWPLIDSNNGRAVLRAYFDRYIGIARHANTGYVLDTATWRAGTAWASAFGVTEGDILDANRRAVTFAQEIRASNRDVEVAINGVLGPAGDGYAPADLLEPDVAAALHAPQIEVFRQAGADWITAMTITHVGEAIGIVHAARAAGIAVIISFTTEIDGCLPTGQTLRAAIEEVDTATEGAPVFYMVNCAHPDHFGSVLDDGHWLGRIGGIRANASRQSHAELDAAETLDDGDPIEFGALHTALAQRLPKLHVVGGCCGTDHRHVECVAETLIRKRTILSLV